MASPSCARPLVGLTKRLNLSSPTSALQCQTRTLRTRASPRHQPRIPTGGTTTQRRHESTQAEAAAPFPPRNLATAAQRLERIRLPRAVQATYLEPLRHKPTHHITVCELQMRSYSVRNLEAFADFAMRAAYYLELPACGPSPLPRIVERWTVPRGSFVHKKSQENFERRTIRRQISIKDGHREVVAAWLGFLRKHQYYGIGMKANVFDYGGLEVVADMDAEAELIEESLGETLELVGGSKKLMQKESKVLEALESEPFKAQWGAHGAMGGAQSAPDAQTRILPHVVRKQD